MKRPVSDLVLSVPGIAVATIGAVAALIVAAVMVTQPWFAGICLVVLVAHAMFCCAALAHR